MLVVVGGDGTLQAALTSLLQTPGAKVPKVFIVPAGTTNMSANAIGLRGSPLRAIKALTRWLTHDDHTAREKPTAVLQVSDSHTRRAQCGLFFGAGSIVTGVRYFHERVRPTGLKGLGAGFGAQEMALLAQQQFVEVVANTSSHGAARVS
ncbi:MAG: acylglycerol kinase family protein, partial [Pseudomonas veronii]|nr:acylglycerol kinase family protein [Pseudomonas veronii]